uniref:NADH-ubiquinone oxidoreductase chain 5 n=1 Tax=Caystrus obscurus TaxID=2575667 RepID=A0A4D6X113_9HEMI|nr:NADH dehydrogenase subunit 5 [Caystrus obscurus]QCI09306.1 NADH dehydrogenase subunit 5 [Caystrus obscurus]
MNYYFIWSFMLLVLGGFLWGLGLYYLFNNYSVFFDWEIYTFNSSCLSMSIYLDWMSLFFMGSVLLICSMVILYSSSYMSHDIFKIRFLYIILLFVISMMFLIISPNMISILLGWDGLGLVSYCLVIYYQNYKSYNAGMLTILMNRVGDVSILIMIAWMFNMGGWNYIYYLFFFDNNLFIWVLMLLVLASFTKSAQVPFSSWLPAAMAAPTPVSALVHSSTLVTAGVYLLIRFSDMFYDYDMSWFLLISCLTMFMAGLSANFEYDLKKIIALSTLSQLGLMMSILFLGFMLNCYLHMLIHAFFKALMFLCAGLIIHCMNNSQDIRHMGNMIKTLPFTCSCFCISNLSLCGFPFLSGFYSKDMILENMTYNYYNFYLYLLFFMSIGLTVSYSLRLIYYCFSGSSGLFTMLNYSEDAVILYSLIMLTFFSVFSGSLMTWLMISFCDFLVFPMFLKLMPILCILLGLWLGYMCSIMFISDNLFGNYFNYMMEFLSLMWFLPNFSTYMIFNRSLYFSKLGYIFMDFSWGEYFISKSLPNFIKYLSSLYFVYQFNNLKIYFISFLFMSIFIIMLF